MLINSHKKMPDPSEFIVEIINIYGKIKYIKLKFFILLFPHLIILNKYNKNNKGNIIPQLYTINKKKL